MTFGRYLLYRLAGAVVVLFGVSVLIFVIARVIPGDPARIALGPTATQEQVERLRERLYLDQPLPIQYWRFLTGVIRGDLGISLYTNRPVSVDLQTYFPATLELVIFAGILMVVLGVPLGLLGARYQDAWPDNLARLVALLGVATPSFVWAIFLMLLFAYFMDFLPVLGRLSEGAARPPTVTGLFTVDALLARDLAAFGDAVRHLILPTLALSLSGLGQAARLTRANVGEVYRSGFIEMARAYGLSGPQIAFKYALRPGMIPTLTVLGLDFAAMLGNAFLVEIVFNWPGMARYGVQAILHKDLNAIVGTVLVISAFFLVVNILVDLLVAYVNPKIRLKGVER